MENLGVDYKLLIAQLINFGIFFFVFKKYIATPFMTYLSTQRKQEEARQKSLNDIKKTEEKLESMEADMRKKAKKQIDEMIAKAKEDAERVRQEIIDQAEKQAGDVVARAKEQLEEEKRALYKEVKGKTVDLSMLMINKALHEYLNEDARKKLTEYIVSNAGKEVQKVD